MRDAPIVEIGVREVSTFCTFADLAYHQIDRSGRQAALQTLFFAHSFLAHCSIVARLLWSREIASHAADRTLAEILDLPRYYHVDDDTVRETLEHYDQHLARGLAARGEIAKIIDGTIGDRDSFEQEFSAFLRHYDPTVDTLTLMESELNLHHLWTEVADIKARVEDWLRQHAVLVESAAEPSIPPRR